MASNSSYETSWADQWDPEPAIVPEKRSTLGGRPKSKGKYSQKMEDGFEKTKAAASHGFTKVKDGAAVGIRWIKEKYHKTTRKH